MLNTHLLIVPVRIPRIDRNAVIHVECKGIRGVIEENGLRLHVTHSSLTHEITVQRAQVLDIHAIVY